MQGCFTSKLFSTGGELEGSSTLFSRHFQRSVFEYMLCCTLQYFVILLAARFKLESQLATALAIVLLNLLAVAMVSRAC